MTGGTLVAAAEMLLNVGLTLFTPARSTPRSRRGTLGPAGKLAFTQVLVAILCPCPPGHMNIQDRGITVAPLFAEAILHIHEDRSVSALFRG